jgi:hypothetical protein
LHSLSVTGKAAVSEPVSMRKVAYLLALLEQRLDLLSSPISDMSSKGCRKDYTRPFGSTFSPFHVSRTERLLISGMILILLKVRRVRSPPRSPACPR